MKSSWGELVSLNKCILGIVPISMQTEVGQMAGVKRFVGQKMEQPRCNDSSVTDIF